MSKIGGLKKFVKILIIPTSPGAYIIKVLSLVYTIKILRVVHTDKESSPTSLTFYQM
jgi:hypothetical protein